MRQSCPFYEPSDCILFDTSFLTITAKAKTLVKLLFAQKGAILTLWCKDIIPLFTDGQQKRWLGWNLESSLDRTCNVNNVSLFYSYLNKLLTDQAVDLTSTVYWKLKWSSLFLEILQRIHHLSSKREILSSIHCRIQKFLWENFKEKWSERGKQIYTGWKYSLLLLLSVKLFGLSTELLWRHAKAFTCCLTPS